MLVWFQHAGKAPVSPVRSAKQESRRSSMDTVLSAATEEEDAAPTFEPEPEEEPAKPVKKVDISNFINDALINELSDKNWKVTHKTILVKHSDFPLFPKIMLIRFLCGVIKLNNIDRLLNLCCLPWFRLELRQCKRYRT